MSSSQAQVQVVDWESTSQCENKLVWSCTERKLVSVSRLNINHHILSLAETR